MAEKTIRLQPRLPEKLVRELKADCKKQGRTVEGGVRIAVQFYLNAQKETV